MWACGLVVAPLLCILFLSLLRSLYPCGLPFLIGWHHREHSGTLGAPEPIGAAGPVVFLVLLGGSWLPFLGPALIPLGASGPPNRCKTAQNRLKRGKSKTFFEGRWCFIGNLRHLNRAKTKIFLNLGLKRWANCGLPWLRSSVALGSWSGLPLGFPGACALIVHRHSKIVSLGYPCAIAFSRCSQISVLRAF